MLCGHEPRPASSETEAGHENPASVDGVFGHHAIDEAVTAWSTTNPPGARRTIRRHHDRVERGQSGQSDLSHELIAVEGQPLAARMQREDEGAWPAWIVVCRNGPAGQQKLGPVGALRMSAAGNVTQAAAAVRQARARSNEGLHLEKLQSTEGPSS